jgi:hypothetical protein
MPYERKPSTRAAELIIRQDVSVVTATISQVRPW